MEQIKNRYTGEVMFGGLSLKVVIERHKNWLYGEKDGTRADLTYADLTGADLTGANLTDANLTYANLTGANLTDADLTRANLTRANLTYANLTRAPVELKIPDIHKAVYEEASKPYALDMRQWHTCETTHCRAGWVVTLAGAAGKALEWVYGTAVAANIIYLISDPKIGKMPNFYANNEDAMADMKMRAGL